MPSSLQEPTGKIGHGGHASRFHELRFVLHHAHPVARKVRNGLARICTVGAHLFHECKALFEVERRLLALHAWVRDLVHELGFVQVQFRHVEERPTSVVRRLCVLHHSIVSRCEAHARSGCEEAQDGDERGGRGRHARVGVVTCSMLVFFEPGTFPFKPFQSNPKRFLWTGPIEPDLDGR